MQMLRRVLFLLSIAFLLAVAAWLKSSAQEPCPPPVYDNDHPNWAPGTTVHFSFDAHGQLGAATNPPPAFTLDAAAQNSYAAGMTAWNAHSAQNGTNVTYQQGATSGAFNHIVSVAWPSATITYMDSAGHTHTQPVTATNTQAVATPFYLPDHNSSNQALSTAAVGVTLINTNGTYSVNGITYPMWDPNGTNFSEGLTADSMHETGHGFGLGHQSGCGNVMSVVLVSSQNPTGGTNNSGGCQGSTITPCNDQDIDSRYNPTGCENVTCPPGFVCDGFGGCVESGGCQNDADCPPGNSCNPITGQCEPSGGGGCQFDSDCSCGGTCNQATGECILTYDCSPIVIPVGASAAIHFTSPRSGVWFDLDADGRVERTAWTVSDQATAFLVRDVNGNGQIDNGAELFGNHTWRPSGEIALNGFDALAYHDRPEYGGNGDGLIDANDAIWAELGLWVDWNHNGLSEPAELYKPSDLQLTAISVVPTVTNRADAYGNVLRLKAPCQVGGKNRFGYDVYFSARPPRRPA